MLVVLPSSGEVVLPPSASVVVEPESDIEVDPESSAPAPAPPLARSVHAPIINSEIGNGLLWITARSAEEADVIFGKLGCVK
jgi:hypothetical protein